MNLLKFEKLLFLVIATVASGCQSTFKLPEGPPPADFTLQYLAIDGGDVSSTSAIYIVEPDRILRAATGPGCTLQTYPEPTAQLTEGELQLVYNDVRKVHFESNGKDQQRVDSSSQISIVVTANGQRRRLDLYYLENSGLSYPIQVQRAFNIESLLATLSNRKLR